MQNYAQDLNKVKETDKTVFEKNLQQAVSEASKSNLDERDNFNFLTQGENDVKDGSVNEAEEKIEKNVEQKDEIMDLLEKDSFVGDSTSSDKEESQYDDFGVKIEAYVPTADPKFKLELLDYVVPVGYTNKVTELK